MSFKLNLSTDYSVRPQTRHYRLERLRTYAPAMPSKGQMAETLLVAALIIVAALGLACAI